MMHARTAATALGAAALLAVCLGTAAAQDAPKPFRLGVVDLKECFKKERYARMKDVHEKIVKLRQEYTAELKDLETRLNTLRERLDGTQPGTELYTDLVVQIRTMESKLKVTKEMNQYRLREQSSDQVREAYNEIRRVVALVGQEQKYDLVLRVEGPEIDGDDPVSVNQQISSRVVLFANSTVDITEAVIKRLNEEYAKKKEKK